MRGERGKSSQVTGYLSWPPLAHKSTRRWLASSFPSELALALACGDLCASRKTADVLRASERAARIERTRATSRFRKSSGWDVEDEEWMMMIMTKRRRRPANSRPPTRIPLRQLSSPSTSSTSVSRDLSGRSRLTRGLRMRFRGVRFRELKAIMFAATTGSFYTRAEKRAATFQSDLFFLIPLLGIFIARDATCTCL